MSNDAVLGVTASAKGRAWRWRPHDPRIAAALAQQQQIPELLARILAARGVAPEDVDDFLNPSLRHTLPDPSDFKDMDRAAERFAAAVMKGESIAVFGDYDVDGATSSALLQRFCTAAGRSLRIYIPDRMSEGYGPNAGAMDTLRAEGIALVVTVDCGIAAHNALDHARDIGLQVVVLDHHQAAATLPAALAVVNPNRLDEDTPHRNLAAVGVVFLFAIAVNRILRAKGWYRERPEPDLRYCLDLVALGTVADVVPLTGLNRVLVAQGLKVMAERRNRGLAALADVAKLQQVPTAYHLGYVLGPRVNAGGRVGQSDLGARLLASDDPQQTAAWAARLQDYNAERQAIEADVLGQALHLAEAKYRADAPLLIVASAAWHAGVIGIVASRLKDKFRCPTIVFAIDEEGVAKGSGRSVPGVDLGAAVAAARQAGKLSAGGGHAMAAGMTLAAADLVALESFISDRLAPQWAIAPDLASLNIDAVAEVPAIDRALFDEIAKIGPYGAGHAEPRLAIAHARIVKADIVGERHVRLILSGDGGGEGKKGRLKAIAFGVLDEPVGAALSRGNGQVWHFAGHLRADDWAGKQDVQLIIDDAARA